ncbi:diacylglycerol kinase (ATP) [Microbacterium sp. W4I4]|uniref:diacylglycerol/lipid kinase family protein n=1 Tax=Microbacterium sp. W4I4 TaxID=3042295 RepID=UPI0027816A67|nr:YegS/Rv2252/BmrU family lipid kinase [Microbacterium sp. W4I4]MDQ0612764.1 diacylglycerol kinase (ATP) [Microbacterium sp. W4I4]
MAETPRLAMVVNPLAGKGRGAHAAAEAERVLRAAGASVSVFTGSSAAQTRAVMRQIVDGNPDGVVVVGGDGTLTGIVDVLADAHLPITLVPAGTGNDLARALGIPTGAPGVAAMLALEGLPRRIDLGTVESQGESRPFLTVAALGFDAKVSERTNILRHPSGRLRYYLALVIELLRLRPTDFVIRMDDGAPKRMPGTLLAVGNTPTYGGGMPICRDAEPDDGLLDIVHVAPLGRVKLLRVFPLLLRGTHLGRSEVTHRRAARVRASAPGLIVYADGERAGSEECTIGIRPGAVTMMVPKERPDEV